MKRYSKLVLLILVFISLVGIVKIQRVMNDDLPFARNNREKQTTNEKMNEEKILTEDTSEKIMPLTLDRFVTKSLSTGSWQTLLEIPDTTKKMNVKVMLNDGTSWVLLRAMGPKETVLAQTTNGIYQGQTSIIMQIPANSGIVSIEAKSGAHGTYTLNVYQVV